MSNLTDIPGIAEKTAKALNLKGITTIEQLAELKDDGTIKGIRGISNFIMHAKNIMKSKKPLNEKEEDDDEKKTEIEISPDNIIEMTKTEEKQKQQQTIIYIETHSWYGRPVNIPRLVTVRKQKMDISEVDYKDQHLIEEYELQPAQIFEMSIYPGGSITFLCEWKTDNHSASWSFSPSFLLSLNPTLPKFKFHISSTDWELVPNKKVVEQILQEIQLLSKLLSNKKNKTKG